VFANMPFGHFFMVLFFILTSIAALGAMLSLLEAPVSVVSEQFGWPRSHAIGIILFLLMIVGAGCALSESWAAEIKIFSMTFFDFLDFITSKILLPLVGMFICIFVGWVWGYPNLKAALSNEGELNNGLISAILFFILRFISPILILVVMLKGLNVF
jgi:NSS family neurotransmitter:Na+ symporter